MPIFDFRCTDCGEIRERLVRHDAVPPCSACGSPRTEKLVACPAAPGQSKALVGAARAQAKAEGHFSHY